MIWSCCGQQVLIWDAVVPRNIVLCLTSAQAMGECRNLPPNRTYYSNEVIWYGWIMSMAIWLKPFSNSLWAHWCWCLENIASHHHNICCISNICSLHCAFCTRWVRAGPTTHTHTSTQANRQTDTDRQAARHAYTQTHRHQHRPLGERIRGQFWSQFGGAQGRFVFLQGSCGNRFCNICGVGGIWGLCVHSLGLFNRFAHTVGPKQDSLILGVCVVCGVWPGINWCCKVGC